ncbi:hypothetical protein chiPu_0026187, partial [Chiloscyllium punctatum]|nr:hypothetical protein [Chiloscyllium punctatum]
TQRRGVAEAVGTVNDRVISVHRTQRRRTQESKDRGCLQRDLGDQGTEGPGIGYIVIDYHGIIQGSPILQSPRQWEIRDPRRIRATTEDSEEQKEWEPLDHLPPPYVTPSGPQNDPSGDDDSGEGEENGEESPAASGVQTRSQAERSHRQNPVSIARMNPLREVPMGGEEGGTGYMNVPLTSTEVRNYKREMKGLLEDPMGLAEQLDQFLGPNNYTWEEMYSIMGALFSSQERQMIRQAALLVWAIEGRAGGEQKFPLTDPEWDKNTEEGRRNMRDMREYWIKGIRQAAPKGHNFIKAFGNHQNPEETPTEFLDRIRKNLQQFAGVDPEMEVGQQLIRGEFVSKAWPDIRNKLEKMDNWDSKPL